MSYQYSNPYRGYYGQSEPPPQPYEDRVPVKEQFKVLFTGLPAGLTSQDLYEALTKSPLNLPRTTRVFNMHQPDGHFLGIAVVSVDTQVEAERLRVEYNGKVIDHNYRLSVHHILPVDHKYPLLNAVGSNSANPAQNLQHTRPGASSSAGKANPALRDHVHMSSSSANQSRSKGKQKAITSVPNKKESGKPLGLKLLDRISKPNKPPNQMDQITLLERQRANLQKFNPGGPGKAFAMRIQPSIPSKTRKSRKSKADKVAAKSNHGAASKVSRAKKKLNDSAMDVDEDLTFENTANHGQGYWRK
ncbi:hypothetical protein C362_02546 [Cryptococcus neoformans Bt1]|nr:hypothetical protein C362_02546 [Cryptococcus neoformans var. grubii Bt1]